MTEEEGEREGQGEYIMGKIITLRKYFRPLKNLKNQEKKNKLLYYNVLMYSILYLVHNLIPTSADKHCRF